VRPLQLGGRTVHQVCLPWHFGTYRSNEQGVTGDAANDLVAITGDPNVSIQESKAFRCNVRAGRRDEETTERLAGVDSTPEPADPGADHPAEHPERGAQTEHALFRYGHGEPRDMTEIAVHRREPTPRMGFFTDTTTCIGCKACEVACKQWNELPADGSRPAGSYDYTGGLSASTWRHVRFVEVLEPEPLDLPLVDIAAGNGSLDRWVFMSDVCKHCTNAGCLDACPTGALIRTEFQTVILQPDVCNGCGYCVPACPFGVIDRDPYDGRAAKCTLCYDRLEDGLEPACAKACPTDSIQFGEYDELVERAQARVLTLHERGLEGAYLYGAGDGRARSWRAAGRVLPADRAAERYGLPATPTRRSSRTCPRPRPPGCWPGSPPRRSRRRACWSPTGGLGEPPAGAAARGGHPPARRARGQRPGAT
jgi:formate dehydrogenase iron-sulfur subunit